MPTRWNPWQDLFDIQREMNQLGRRVFGSGELMPLAGRPNGNVWSPAVDVFTRGEDLVVRAELPGVDPERDIDISLQDGILTIRGERRHEDRTEKDHYYRFESTYGLLPSEHSSPAGGSIRTTSARPVRTGFSKWSSRRLASWPRRRGSPWPRDSAARP